MVPVPITAAQEGVSSTSAGALPENTQKVAGLQLLRSAQTYLAGWHLLSVLQLRLGPPEPAMKLGHRPLAKPLF